MARNRIARVRQEKRLGPSLLHALVAHFPPSTNFSLSQDEEGIPPVPRSSQCRPKEENAQNFTICLT